MEKKREKFDVAVIGGGPAGMMAAFRASELGARVILLEGNLILGKKLLLTGGGRCNITNIQFEAKEFARALGKNGKFLASALSVFGPKDVMEFFESHTVRTKIEKEGRVFPVSDRAQDVLEVLRGELKKNKVEIRTGVKVLKFSLEKKQIEYIETSDGKKVYADRFVLATGGKSYSKTGSVGAGYAFAKSLGHAIVKTSPALVPLRIKEEWTKKLQGLGLQKIKLDIFQAGKKQGTYFGEMLFTHLGISGPAVLNSSKKVGELLSWGEVKIRIDLEPSLSFQELDQKLQAGFGKNSNRDFVNYLVEILPKKMTEIIPNLLGIEARRKINFVTKIERQNLAKLLKNLELTVEGLLGYDQAMVTSGGVSLKEINSKTMQSKIIDNLAFAGEIIDLDGPTGGYNLQICWSSGHTAGSWAGK